MPKPTLAATTTATITSTVKMTPTALQMLKARLREHQDNAKRITDLKTRQDRLAKEVDELFVKQKQGKALADGTEVDGHRLKLVTGETKAFDQLGFMKKHGLTEADFEEFTTSKPKKPYIKFTHPGAKKEDE